jgi:hypothetical protein
MFINDSGAKPMDAFCGFPKQSASRARSTIEFQCHRALFGVCFFATAMFLFPTAWDMHYESVLFPCPAMDPRKATDTDTSISISTARCQEGLSD